MRGMLNNSGVERWECSTIEVLDDWIVHLADSLDEGSRAGAGRGRGKGPGSVV